MQNQKRRRRRKTSRKGRLDSVKRLLQDKNTRDLLIQIIRAIIEGFKR